MIDLQTEQLRPLTEASQHVPGNPHVSTLFRWWRRGVRGVRLETLVIGGRRYTSVEAIQRFVARLSQADTAPCPGTTLQRQREMLHTDEQLDAIGL